MVVLDFIIQKVVIKVEINFIFVLCRVEFAKFLSWCNFDVPPLHYGSLVFYKPLFLNPFFLSLNLHNLALNKLLSFKIFLKWKKKSELKKVLCWWILPKCYLLPCPNHGGAMKHSNWQNRFCCQIILPQAYSGIFSLNS